MGREKTLQSTKKVIITHSLAVEWYMSVLAHVIVSRTKVEGRAVRTFAGELNWDGRSHGNLLSWSGAAAICVSHTFSSFSKIGSDVLSHYVQQLLLIRYRSFVFVLFSFSFSGYQNVL